MAKWCVLVAGGCIGTRSVFAAAERALDGSILSNVYVCQSIVDGQPQCAKPLQDFNACLFSACGACMDDTEFSTCLNTAASPGGVCADNNLQN